MSDRNQPEQPRHTHRHHHHRGGDEASYSRGNQPPPTGGELRPQQLQQPPQSSSPMYQNDPRYRQGRGDGGEGDRRNAPQQIDPSLAARYQQPVQLQASENVPYSFFFFSQITVCFTLKVGGRQRPVVFVIYYSMYGHVKQLALKVVSGLEKNGVEARLFQVQETLPREVLDKMHAPPTDPSIPVIDVHRLPEADGFMFGFPTRFGSAPAQMRALFDACGQHWTKNTLYQKPAGIFFSTAGLGGGQETTALTTVTFLTHLGMIFVPLGYKNPKLHELKEVHGGSPYGAGTLAGGAGDRQPTALELDVAESQGYNFAQVVKKLAA
ncbi:unnamed protein product [Didymodactylos carnosus]|uniref:Flavodoxin-like domain-containing protein n=1 Tax=Didymodactylos carnosus TaxID=1234261 RepID=A0A8S2P5Q4_9BILA|nr:unnamed protein product [Didymodactylos carnosus]CAF4027134.1 unnamed protein product [Didymodactylos carnosus]